MIDLPQDLRAGVAALQLKYQSDPESCWTIEICRWSGPTEETVLWASAAPDGSDAGGDRDGGFPVKRSDMRGWCAYYSKAGAVRGDVLLTAFDSGSPEGSFVEILGPRPDLVPHA